MSENRPLAAYSDGELAAILEWYRASGVDIAVGDEPVDRFASSRMVPARPAPARAEPAAPPLPMLAADPGEAEAIAAGAATLDELAAALAAWAGCGLKHRATQLVFADGNPQAHVMLIGEAPGAEEDRIGRPFVGRAGQLLDRMLSAIGLDRTRVYIANTVPWRPPGNREPTPQEVAACAPFLNRQVELVAPAVVLTLGNVPTKALFSTQAGITRMRGQRQDLAFNSHRVPTLATFHPAFLLRNPSAKALAWKDFLTLSQMMPRNDG